MSKKIKMRVPETISYAKAIRRKCLECCCGQFNEVKYCEIVDCELFPYRFGTSPVTFIKRNKENVKIVE